MENAATRTELSQLGEFGLINQLQNFAHVQNPDTLMGIGDDAAVIDCGDHVRLISTDMMVEGIHFDLSYMPLMHLGYKAVASNVSDIAAMNGTPTQLTVSIAISSKFSVEAIEELYRGVKAACENYKVDLVGGDTTSSRSGLIISIAIIGKALKEEVVYRSTAKAKDIICVTGDLGGAYMGLQLLEREKQVFLSNPEAQPLLEGKDYVIQRQLRPEARMDFVHELKNLGVQPSSMIDISDGLASELLHLCHASKLGARIFENKLPIDAQTIEVANEFNISTNTCVLNGGEDYELLFTINQDDFAKLRNHPDITTIGYMETADKGVNFVTNGQQLVAVTAQGWNHFQEK